MSWTGSSTGVSAGKAILSVDGGILEHMFDVGAAGLLDQMCSATRAESCAAAQRLVAIADLMALRIGEDGGATDLWTVDVVDAVSVEISAALGISRGLADSHLRYAHALRVQIPKVGAAFIAGDIDEVTFRTMVFRTGLILDGDLLAAVDEELAARAPRWGAMNRSQLAARIDRVVVRADADAVRRRKDRIAEREVIVGDLDNGLAELSAILFAPDAHAVAERLTALANTVCDRDPRTLAQRRADAMGAMAAGADRLGCRCRSTDCPAGGTTASTVVIHVIAEAATVAGTGTTPGAMPGYEGLIPAELIAELGASARLRPLVHPGVAPAEPGYVPSRALADFVRARDLTCRAPGCDRPAVHCDIDHTIPHRDGGPTHASNLKCLCRFHHLLKTFWGWHDEQLRDGTVIWTAPTGDKYVTLPGGALTFPGMSLPTGPISIRPRAAARCTDKTAMMPRRTRTRAQSRADAITAERSANRQRRTSPAPPAKADEDFTYEETLTQEPIPPPF
jgi:Domain of unknown function (DUF222)